MNVFISWSGIASQSMAKALADWLPSVIQVIRPFFSSEDIQKGTRWFSEIGDKLDKTDYGILCLTKSNLSSPWIHFEAGALSKRVDVARVVPFLLDVKPTDLTPPLSNFNAVAAPNADEVWKLVKDMNAALGETRLGDGVLEKSFGRAWSELEKAVKEVQVAAKKEIVGAAPQKRPVEDLLEEVLLLARNISQRQQETPQRVADLFGGRGFAFVDKTRYGLESVSSARQLSELGPGAARRELMPESTNLGQLLRSKLEDEKP